MFPLPFTGGEWRQATLNDGSAVLEAFDYRSEFAFDDFTSWIADTLIINPISGEIGDNTEPFSFEWSGSVFKAAWNDLHGCFIALADGPNEALRQIQGALSS